MHTLEFIQRLRPIEAVIQILNRVQQNLLLRDILFQTAQEERISGTLGQDDNSDYGKEHSQAALENEQVRPAEQLSSTGGDVEDAKGEETTERGRKDGSGVEDAKA